jgi:catechol 2,3-dioxygenase-like lactoylglutathione lyase family enzyme
MSDTQVRSETAIETPRAQTADMKLEVVVIPVSDVDRAKSFYGKLGWRLDADFAAGDDWRGVQFTPPGELLRRGVEVSEVFHDAGDAHTGADEPYLFGRLRVSGPDPDHRSYRSYASFSDPDGNGWLLQEVTVRLPGRVDADDTTFTSSTELAAALRRASAAHGEHEKRTGHHDDDWPDWYAEYIVREQAGKPLPS